MGMGGMDHASPPPTGSPGSDGRGTAAAAATMKRVAAAFEKVSGVRYTFTSGGSDMMLLWPNGHGTLQGRPTPALDADIEHLMAGFRARMARYPAAYWEAAA